MTCHDGFPLADLVSYNEKHNEANGEWNRDGTNDNFSWNCGEEGATDNPEITSLRARQSAQRRRLTVLAHSVPACCWRAMNWDAHNTVITNAYCQDNEISWRWIGSWSSAMHGSTAFLPQS